MADHDDDRHTSRHFSWPPRHETGSSYSLYQSSSATAVDDPTTDENITTSANDTNNTIDDLSTTTSLIPTDTTSGTTTIAISDDGVTDLFILAVCIGITILAGVTFLLALCLCLRRYCWRPPHYEPTAGSRNEQLVYEPSAIIINNTPRKSKRRRKRPPQQDDATQQPHHPQPPPPTPSIATAATAAALQQQQQQQQQDTQSLVSNSLPRKTDSKMSRSPQKRKPSAGLSRQVARKSPRPKSAYQLALAPSGMLLQKRPQIQLHKSAPITPEMFKTNNQSNYALRGEEVILYKAPSFDE